ncbi:MAG: hypothetical protein ACK5AZ_07745 [Bryobacteraceae bacterium]
MATPALTGALVYQTPPDNNVDRHVWESNTNFFKELSDFTVDEATSL